MVSLEVYRVLHILGLLMLFSGLAGLWGTRVLGQAKPSRRMDVSLALIHGFGLFIILVSGFGMLARLGLVQGLPTWVYIKLGIWFALGGAMTLAKRKSQWGLPLIALFITLGITAGYLGIMKPMS